MEALDLRDAVMIGHSTGGGEVARYLGRHGTKRAAKAALISAIPPLMLKTATNPGGLPIEVFDGIRAGLIADRSQYYRELGAPFYGANRPGSKVSQGVKDAFWLWSMQAGIAGAYRMHQGILGNRSHRGPQEDRYPDAAAPRRRRPDRADRKFRAAVFEANRARPL